MSKLILLGDEAIAQGAIDSGLSGVFGYPGTPSTEIFEYVQNDSYAKEKNIHMTWSANEKTAMEEALGMSYTGKRVLVTMKHVGLNVAADAFMNSALTGANGGAIFAVADDPSMHSSQNEQDSRVYGKFAMLNVLEPGNQQEAYDMQAYGFSLSEKFHLPVLLRITTRLSHSRADVIRGEILPENRSSLPDDPNQFMLLPAFARVKYKKLLALQKEFEKASEESPFNQFTDAEDRSVGIIACGLAYNYLMENYQDNPCPHPVLKISQYPLPRKLVQKIMDTCSAILVLEEGMPVVEELLRGYTGKGLDIRGRLDGTLPRDGELDPALVRKALALPESASAAIPAIVRKRPPALCNGCPHIDSYKALNSALEKYGKGHVFSDIGCYTLGFLPPYNAINTCVDMGASVSMAVGAACGGLFPSVGVIGDSTFGHSGLTGLLDAVKHNSNVVIVILDNDITAMTGMQESAVTGRIEDICAGIGVSRDHIRVITPLPNRHEENVKIMTEEIEYPGVSVIIPRRPCIHVAGRKRNSGGTK